MPAKLRHSLSAKRSGFKPRFRVIVLLASVLVPALFFSPQISRGCSCLRPILQLCGAGWITDGNGFDGALQVSAAMARCAGNSQSGMLGPAASLR